MENDVTIGIPLYRSEKYVKDSIISALSQSYPYIDFLIIDDACDDGSVEIVSQMQAEHPRGKNIRLIRHTQNVGIGETRNHLIAEAKTKYLFFLDADDVVAENSILLLHDAAEKNKADLVIVGHSAKEVYEEIITKELVTRMEHAAYLGSELQKAEIAMITGKDYVQDFELFKNPDNFKN